MQVAKSESISKAASALHLSQPALSKSIIKLERELGCALFDRTGKRVLLNDKGKILLKGVERALRDLGDVAAVVGSSEEEGERTLSVGVFGPQAAAIDCVERFMELNDAVSVTFDARRQTAASEMASEYDALFFPDTDGFSHVSGVVVSYCKTMLRVPPEHRLAGSGSVDLADCRSDSFVLMNTTAGTLEQSYQLCADSGFDPRVRAVTTSGAACNRFVDAGVGISFVTAPTHAGEPADPRLVALRGEMASEALLFACAPDSVLSDTARSFRDFALGFFDIPNDRRTLSLFERN